MSDAWRRWPAAAVALATPVELVLGLAASIQALYYVALLLFVPLALFRVAVAAGATAVWWRPGRAWRWVWAGALAHAALVACLLRGQADERLPGGAPWYGAEGVPGMVVLAWPLLLALAMGAVLLREARLASRHRRRGRRRSSECGRRNG